MKKIILLLIFVIITNCNSKKKNSIVYDKSKTSIKKDEAVTFKESQVDTTFVLSKNRDLNDFKKNIKNISQILINDIFLRNHFIESTIPINDSEFSYFYSLTYSSKEESNLFYSLNEIIVEASNEDKSNCLKLFLNLAEFVDGDYAEAYFDDIEYVALNIPEKVSNTYNALSKPSRKRLKIIYNKICKN